MSSWWFSAVAVITLTLLSIFIFPGRTILQADTQIYIPILEHIADPTLLTNDIMAVRPHVSFTLYDEAALILRGVTGLSFEQILAGQQIVYRAVAVLGLYLLAMAAGLAPAMSWLFAALISLGGAIIGPAVLIVEYEPVPRGFALPFLILSLAMVASRQWYAAAASATLAFAFHPPTALAYCGVLGFVLLWNRAFGAIAVLAIGPLVLLLSVMLQAPIEKAPLFGAIDPVWESLQRMRAAGPMDVVVCGSVGSGLGGVVAGAKAVQSRNEPDPFANAGHRDVECSAVIRAARAHEASHYSPISAWPLPVIRVALRHDSGRDCGYLRGAAKAISGGFCVLHRSDRGVSGGMGYLEAAGRPGDRCFRLGCPGNWRGGERLSPMAGSSGSDRALSRSPLFGGSPELCATTYLRIGRPRPMGSWKYTEGSTVPVRGCRTETRARSISRPSEARALH